MSTPPPRTPASTEATPEQYTALAQLGAAYCLYVDAPDEAGLTSIFTTDAVFTFGRREISGRDELVPFFVASPRGTHVSGPPLVRLTPSGASGQSRFVFVPADGGPTLTGAYEDAYVEVDGRWRFASRTAVMVRSDTR